MDATDNLKLPFILPSQAQKHVTHNEALLVVDALVQLSVESRTLTAPPDAGELAAGDRFIVADGARGAWAGHDGDVAAWQDGAWRFHEPQPGWLCWLVADEALYVRGRAAGPRSNCPLR